MARSNLQYRVERISVWADATLPSDSTARAELYYHPRAANAGLYVESAYYDTKLGPGRIRVGRGSRLTFGITPAYPNRKTSNYGIVGETFTRNRIQGVQYVHADRLWDLGAGAHTALRPGTRALGEVPGSMCNGPHAVPHLSMRDLPALSQRVQGARRLKIKPVAGLNAGVSASPTRAGALPPAQNRRAGNPRVPGGGSPRPGRPGAGARIRHGPRACP
ncbi:MAG: hypothetical protein HY321_11525 [Armatimonadetes bacterium]|nr:hypothetical protein [Armatimonadota bacterium]